VNNMGHKLIHPTIPAHLFGRDGLDAFLRANDAAMKKIDLSLYGMIGFIGTVAAGKDLFYDVDLVSIPNLGVGLGRFFMENARHIQLIDRELRNHDRYAATAAKFSYQEETYYLAALANGGFDRQIRIHNLIFADMQNVFTVTDQEFVGKVHNNLVPIYGDKEFLLTKPVTDPVRLEPHYTVAEAQLLYLNQYPCELALDKARNKLIYSAEHLGNLTGITPEKVLAARTLEDMTRIVQEGLLEADRHIELAA